MIADRASLPRVSVIIPAFNKAGLTGQCLAALARLADPVPCEVIVVDNASSDATPDLLRGLPWVRSLRNADNLGFAKACNQGAAVARGRHLVFLNNDTIPLDGWLEPLVREAEADPRVGMVGSKLLYEDGTVQHAGVVFARATRIPYHPYRFLPSKAPCVNVRKDLQAVTAACVLMPAEAFRAHQGFCEEYRNGWEDLDLCVRMRMAKRRVIYQPASCLYHLESQSPGRMDRDDQNKALFFRKWQGLLLSDEDAFHLQDGSCMAWIRAGAGQARVRPLRSDREQGRWALPAALQCAAAEADLPVMREALACPEAWPEDPLVLGWAGLIAHSFELPGPARSFLERALAIHDTLEVRTWMATLLGIRDALPEGAEAASKPLALAAARDLPPAEALLRCQRALLLGGGSADALRGLRRAALDLGDAATVREAEAGLAHLGLREA